MRILRGLGLSYSEDRGPTIRANALHGRFTVLERDVRRVLYLNIRLAFNAIRLWHVFLWFGRSVTASIRNSRRRLKHL